MFTCGFKSDLFAQGSLSCLEESGWSNYLEGASFRDNQEMALDWHWYHASPIMGLWETITCMDLKELRSSQTPRGILTDESVSSRGIGQTHLPMTW